MGLVSGVKQKRGWEKIDIFGRKIKKPLAKTNGFLEGGVSRFGGGAGRG